MNDLQIMQMDDTDELLVQMYDEHIQAGFPSPAQGSYPDKIDLNKELIQNPAATFCARVTGNSMIDAGISEGDILIVDRSLTPSDGEIAVCFLDGEFTVKRVAIESDGVYLVPANKSYPKIKVMEESSFQVWGVVSHIIHKTTL
ncbi:MAG: translesion error-prone DNA polymerase V autoproteolytic subunit [Muribaculaceae bacterium]|nr:translesion error-prone DNA polymerase V autoproteolytic subunit [Muribaculaceae bacterium]